MKPQNKKQKRLLLLTLVVLLVTLLSLNRGEDASQKLLNDAKEVPLTKITTFIQDGDVEKAEVHDGTNIVVVTTEDGDTYKAEYPFSYSDTLTENLVEADVETKAHAPEAGNIFVSMLFSFLPLIIFLGLIVWLMKSGGLTGGIGKLTGKRGQAIGEIPTTRFSDVAGVDEAVNDMKELVEFFHDDERFTRVGAKPPRGALLVGPPGTGKTLLARAVAGEAGVPFFPLAGSDFVETFAGVGARRVRDLFDKAREAGSAIIFIDEIDAIGRSRSVGPVTGGDGERENTLVSMLNEMDGFDSSHRIIILAATNRADVLDAALTRPGRLDRQIVVPNPDRKGREDILRVHSKDRPLHKDVNLEGIARRTPGTSGAELAQIVNEACMEAARRSLVEVNQDCFDAGIATLVLGRARTSALVTEADRSITAWHEAGHTLAALLSEDADDPVQVSIIPRGPAGGVTWMSGNDNLFLTRKSALAQLRVSMAGRAAEEILLDGEYTQGAHGDLDSASKLAIAMITKYGMSPDGSYLLADDDTVRMGGEVSANVRDLADGLIRDAHQEAAALLHEHRQLLEVAATTLLERENLTLAEIKELQADLANAQQV